MKLDAVTRRKILDAAEAIDYRLDYSDQFDRRTVMFLEVALRMIQEAINYDDSL